MRRHTAASACAGAALTLSALLGPAAVSAPAPGPRPGATTSPSPGEAVLGRTLATATPRGDRDGDRVSDDFEARLRSARADEQLWVIITGPSARAAQAAVGRFTVTHRLPLVDGFAARMSAAQARGLSHLPSVRRVEQNGIVRILDDATSDDFGTTAARLDRVGLDNNTGLTGKDVGICFVDTGVDPQHEQLDTRIAGFYDAIHNTTPTAFDDEGHGTHVASIAAGDGVGSTGANVFMGVAPGARIYAAKALDSQGSGANADVVRGMQWCAGLTTVKVISLSIGDTTVSSGGDIMTQAVDAAVASGKVVVVAAGNSGDQPQTINSPGTAASAITVGAVSDWSAPAETDRHDEGIFLAPWSSRGPTLNGLVKPDIAAPGYTVTAALAGYANGYVTMSGTSMATPYVAGAVALALQADPSATPAGIKSALMATAADRGAPGTDNEWGAGLIDVRAFVDAVAQRSDQTFDTASVGRTSFPTLASYSGTVPRNGYVDIPVAIPAGGGGVPLALTLTITSGSAICYYSCLIVEWGPDLDLQLRTTGGVVLAQSQCALDELCGIGRQETIGYANPAAGTTYIVRVLAFTGDPNKGKGGSFRLDVSRGPLATVGGGGATNLAPIANAGPDRTYRISRKTGMASFTLDGSASSDPDGTVSTWTWTGASSGSGSKLNQTKGIGEYTYQLVVTDNQGRASDADFVTIKVTN